MNDTEKKCDIGLVGLAIMGENLVLTWQTTISKSPYSTALPARWMPLSKDAPWVKALSAVHRQFLLLGGQ